MVDVFLEQILDFEQLFRGPLDFLKLRFIDDILFFFDFSYSLFMQIDDPMDFFIDLEPEQFIDRIQKIFIIVPPLFVAVAERLVDFLLDVFHNHIFIIQFIAVCDQCKIFLSKCFFEFLPSFSTHFLHGLEHAVD